MRSAPMLPMVFVTVSTVSRASVSGAVRTSVAAEHCVGNDEPRCAVNRVRACPDGQFGWRVVLRRGAKLLRRVKGCPGHRAGGPGVAPSPKSERGDKQQHCRRDQVTRIE